MQGAVLPNRVMDYQEPANFGENQAGNTGKFGYQIKGDAQPMPRSTGNALSGPLPEIGTSINFGEFRPADSNQGRQQNFDQGRNSGRNEGEQSPGEAPAESGAAEGAAGEAGTAAEGAAAAGGLEDVAALALL